MGTRTENTISAVPPCLPDCSGRSARCQHTGCPLTLAMRQKILRFPCSPCPRRPICCSAFRTPLSYGALSVDALAALLPRPWFILCYDCYTPFVSACQARNCIAGGQAYKKTVIARRPKGPTWQSPMVCRSVWGIATPVCFAPHKEPPSAVALCTCLRAQWFAMTVVVFSILLQPP